MSWNDACGWTGHRVPGVRRPTANGNSCDAHACVCGYAPCSHCDREGMGDDSKTGEVRAQHKLVIKIHDPNSHWELTSKLEHSHTDNQDEEDS